MAAIEGVSAACRVFSIHRSTYSRVKSGVTVSAIAQRFGTTVSKLAQLNHLKDPGHLVVGQPLLIPML